MQQLRKILCLFCLVIVAAAAAPRQEQQKSPPAEQPKSESPAEEKPDPAAGAAAPVDPKTFKIGPEDVLMVRVWREPELSGPVVVRPDGMVTIPLAGDIQVVGLTPEQLGEKLKQEFAKFVNNPLVMVSVQQVRSKKYYVTGNMARTGPFPLVVPTTVLEAVTIAGGFTEWANRKKVVIMRGTKRFRFNYKEVIEGKNPDQNIYLENGDFIIVD